MEGQTQEVHMLTEVYVVLAHTAVNLTPQQANQMRKEEALNSMYPTYELAKAAGADLIERYQTAGTRFEVRKQYAYNGQKAVAHVATEENTEGGQ